MITDPDQVEALIESTEALIAEDGLDIALSRSAWVETPAGGVRPGASGPLPSVRRFFGAVTMEPARVVREEGEQLVLRHILVGMPGDDIKAKDSFTIDDRKYEVYEIDPNNTWQTKGWCIERA